MLGQWLGTGSRYHCPTPDASGEGDRLHEAASEAFKLNQLESSIFLYHRTYLAAVRAENQRWQTKYLIWKGYILKRTGRLWETLACLLAMDGLEHADKADYWERLIGQIRIAIEFPISLEKTRKLTDRYRVEMGRLGLNASRGMLFIQESNLASYRYDDRTVLAMV